LAILYTIFYEITGKKTRAILTGRWDVVKVRVFSDEKTENPT